MEESISINYVFYKWQNHTLNRGTKYYKLILLAQCS